MLHGHQERRRWNGRLYQGVHSRSIWKHQTLVDMGDGSWVVVHESFADPTYAVEISAAEAAEWLRVNDEPPGRYMPAEERLRLRGRTVDGITFDSAGYPVLRDGRCPFCDGVVREDAEYDVGGHVGNVFYTCDECGFASSQYDGRVRVPTNWEGDHS